MTRDETIDMALEAGMNVHFASRHKTYLAAFEAIVRAEEREACAALAENEAQYSVATAIRERSLS
jgi:superoxide dismutase